MIAFTGMLFRPAEEAGMKTPKSEDYSKDEFPHFFVFEVIQIGRPIPDWGSSVRNNAKIIASIPEEKIRTMKWYEVLEMGIE